MADIQKRYATAREIVVDAGRGADCWNVALGVVTSNLKEYRAKLVETLAANRDLKVQTVELGELMDDRDAVRKKLENVDVFVQLFDYSAVRAERGDPPGGHLAVQRALVAPKTQMLWWMPPAAGGNGAGREQDAAHLKVIDELAAGAAKGDQSEAEAALLRLLGAEPQRGYAQVIVECNSIDRQDVESACRVVESIWKSGVGGGLKLYMGTVPFRRLVSDAGNLDSLDGIVLVDRSQQVRALFDQAIKIQEQLDQHQPAADVA
jgi:hypothetical protein